MKQHPVLGLVKVLEAVEGGTLVELESGEKRVVTTEWLTEPKTETPKAGS